MCQQIIDYYDTAGNPVYKINCDCGTTACRKLNSFGLVNKKTEITNENEFTQEEEKRFYDKIFNFPGLTKLKKLSN